MAKKKKTNGSLKVTKGRNKSLLGQNSIFTPEVIDDIHIKAQLGRYRMRGMALMRKIPTFDDLVFLPGTLTRFVIEGYREKCETKTIIGPRCKNPIELDIPVYITGMSFGALSYEAKTALARGATMAGSATCSGEGGMIPDERRYSEKWFYQCIQSRYGFNPHHAQLADGIEVFIGQGQKVGMGGHLMGQKVTDQVAEMRSLPSGIDQRSPARHPDWLGPDDLFLKVQELRELTNNQVPIQLKLGAAKVYDDVRMAAKCDPDSIYLDGMEGSTGAGPHIAAANTGIPGIAAIREARRALDDVGQTGKVTLIYAGGVRDGADLAKALALGADAVGKLDACKDNNAPDLVTSAAWEASGATDKCKSYMQKCWFNSIEKNDVFFRCFASANENVTYGCDNNADGADCVEKCTNGVDAYAVAGRCWPRTSARCSTPRAWRCSSASTPSSRPGARSRSSRPRHQDSRE